MHDLVHFQFEDKPLSMNNLRALILQEVLDFNPDFIQSFEQSGVMEQLPQNI